MEKKKAVEETFRQLKKQYDVDMKQADELPYAGDSIVSTGIVSLDAALGVGGIKKGSIVEIYAPESAGKTTLALHMCREYLKLDMPVLYIDSERTLTREIIKSMGMETDHFYVVNADTIERALEICRICAPAFGAIVIDSLAGTICKAQKEGDVGDSHVGTFARIMSDALPMLVSVLADHECTLIVITHLREKIGVMFGNPEHATGGRALKYYASVRLEIRRLEFIKSGGNVAGARIKAKVVKNKISMPYREAEFDLILDQAAERKIVDKTGAWYLYEGKRIGQGRENAKQYLKEHPKERGEIAEKLKAIHAPT